MNLYRMSLSDLANLNVGISTLINAGKVLDAGGMAPEFDIGSGSRVLISLAPIIPDDVRKVDDQPCVIAPAVPVKDMSPPVQVLSGPSAPEVHPAAVKASSKPPEMPNIPKWDGGSSILANAQPAAAVPAKTAYQMPDIWTPEEDRDLVGQVVAGILAGHSQTKAAEEAHIAGRTAGAIKIRARIKLAQAIADALSHAVAETPSKVSVAAVPEAVAPARDEVEYDRTVPLWLRSLRIHLTALGYPEPWSAQRDLAMVTGLFSGRSLASYAESEGLPLLDVKDRFFALREPVLENGALKITGQQHLIAALRERTEVAA
ncbi:MAG: hypothetical protein ACOH2H_16100 [Cypionkella sp.]